MKNIKESTITENIKKYLKSVPDLFFYKTHGGRYGTAGLPDIVVCFRGRFIAFEIKTMTNKATVLQSVTIKKILKAGGYALVVRSVDEVKHVIESFKSELQ